MDVVIIDKENYTVKGSGPVEGLSTKIWTERYSDFGEFSFESNNIAIVRKLLAEGTLISLRDSECVMMVEDHNIVEDGENGQKVVITGRACESILERRVWAGAKYGKKVKMRQKYSIQNAILVFITNLLNNETDNTDLAYKYAPHRPSVDNTIPNLRITDGTLVPLTAKTRFLENSNAWAYVKTMLDSGKFGIRSIRPKAGQTTRKTVHVAGTGTITKPLEASQGRLTFDIYEGTDRTTGQTDRPSIVFSAGTKDITKPEYLFSSKTYRNVALVISGSGPTGGKEIERVWEAEVGGGRVQPGGRPGRTGTGGVIEGIAPGEPYPGMRQPATGWDRREELVDAGSKDDDETTAEFLETLDDVGNDKLKSEFDRISSVEGEISPTTIFKFKVDYDLGDRVTMFGKYGIAQDMVVQEYTRAETNSGEVGYPGLILWT